MGEIWKDHGKIAVETRGDFGFIVHASYGVRMGRRPLNELSPGDIFRARDPETSQPETFRLVALFEDRAEACSSQFSNLRTFPLAYEVEVPGTEEFDESDPLARLWNGVEGAHPHPEFKREDLDDLIDALIEVRDDGKGR